MPAMTRAASTERNHVTIRGSGPRTIVFAHGFGCDQRMWRFVAPRFEATHRVVLFDHAGCGRADPRAYDLQRHASLDGYAQDLVELLQAQALDDVVYVGHSVGAMIGLLASVAAPERFARLQLVAPSPCYVDEPGYPGGFARDDLYELLDLIDRNMLAFANMLAPAAIPPGPQASLTGELEASICAGDPVITRRFAEAIFLSDHRAVLPRVSVPTLILQCADDSIAPRGVGEFMHGALRGSRLEILDASGHCPHMSHPVQTLAALREDLARSGLA